MSKVYAVFAREYSATVRTKAFVIALFLMPVLFALTAALPLLADRHGGARDRTLVVVDDTGVLGPALIAATAARDAKLAEDEADGYGAGRFVIEVVPPASDTAAQGFALSEDVRREAIFAFVELDSTLLTGNAEAPVRYYSDTPSFIHLKRWIENTLADTIRVHRLTKAGIAPETIDALDHRVQLEERSLYATASATEQDSAPRDLVADLAFPIGGSFLMFMVVMLGAGPLMQSVLEEKMNRIAEVLVSSVTPFELMLGKLLGASGVSLTLLSVYLTGAFVASTTLGAHGLFSVGDLLWLLAFLCVALMLYGSWFLAIGAAFNDLRETQTLMMPVMLVSSLPMLLLQVVLTDPNGTLSTALSFVPPFTPVLMLMRMTLSPGAPWWHGGLGLLVSGATAVASLFAAGRVLRIGFLRQGSPPKLREIVRWALFG